MLRPTRRTSLSFAALFAALALCLASVVARATQLPGAIFTTTVTGTTVNGNIYALRTDVYLNGGPQNTKSSGLEDGTYYFQVTDPSGAVLLSSDPASCRQLTVSGGIVTGPDPAAGSCAHAIGTGAAPNGSTPVQLWPYDLTPNAGGEYKVFLISQKASCNTTANGLIIDFTDDCAKTDNFKVEEGKSVAYVTVCKFNDLAGDGIQDPTDPLMQGWPINATGVDAGGMVNQSVTQQTDGTGCTSFSFTDFTNGVANESVTFNEGPPLGVDWHETFPGVDGTGYTRTLAPGDNLTLYFGNHNDNCAVIDQCEFNGPMVATKDAASVNTFKWTVTKTVDQSEIDVPLGTGAKFKYTVTVTHDAGLGWAVSGSIVLTNHSTADRTVLVTDTIPGGTCDATYKSVLVEAGEQVTLPYQCTFADNPGSGTNTVNVYDPSDPSTSIASGTAPYTTTCTGCTASVDDPLDPSTPRTFSYTDSSPQTYSYYHTFTGNAGTCTKYDNTATLTPAGASAQTSSQTVTVCVGLDLNVTKTATPTYTRTYAWTIAKSVSPTLIEQFGGTAMAYYTVTAGETGFTDSSFAVTGTITIANPNDWEDIVANVTDALDSGNATPACTVTGGSGVTILRGQSKTLSYSCSPPSMVAGPNKATASVVTGITATGTASGTAPYTWGAPTSTVNKTITVTDAFNGGSPVTLGTLTATDATPFTSATYKYSRTISVPSYNCVNYPNTAAITQTGQSAGANVEACGPAKTGALTMGYWQNKNGQGIISGANQAALSTWLKQFHPFSDAPSSNIAGYVSGIIGAATCTSSGKTCNAMLRAQMLATALDVYFSDPALGGNKISAAAPIGGVNVDLTKICPGSDGGFSGSGCENVSSVFGGAPSLTVMQMLTYQNTSDPAADAGANWYGQNKAQQVLAKDAFDAINNARAFSP